MVLGEKFQPSLFGFDVRDFARNDVLSYAKAANARWVRAGDLLWSQVEKTPGVYDWSAAANVEANIRRLRQLGLEPMLVVQQSPSWAQEVPGRLCSPPKAEYAAAFANFVAAAAARYSSGETAVHYWEIWNEPDYRVSEVQDIQGFGCWLNDSKPNLGGTYYGEVLQRIFPKVKAANPNAIILAGAFAYELPREQQTMTFLRGMLQSGAGNFDVLSFHAYGEGNAGDLLIIKTLRLRQVLNEFGFTTTPLFATETGATCFSLRSAVAGTCPSDFTTQQANYAARIYPQAIALDLAGALWFSLVGSGSELLANAQLIDDTGANLQPRQAFHAFRNSARLLNGARYIGDTLQEPAAEELNQVQLLTFRKGKNLLYVFWVPTRPDFPLLAEIPVPIGAQARCTQQLQLENAKTFYCPDNNLTDGYVYVGINEFPQYVEVLMP
ncbi:MAG: hypothetical protein Fur005_29280 [Roseiflexaceae bacterium]